MSDQVKITVEASNVGWPSGLERLNGRAGTIKVTVETTNGNTHTMEIHGMSATPYITTKEFADEVASVQ